MSRVDLDPIKHLWRDLKIAVQRRSTSNLTELERICREEWEKLQVPQQNILVALYSPDCMAQIKSNQIKFIYIALRTSADISKCCTETQPKTPNSKQCRCKSTVVFDSLDKGF